MGTEGAGRARRPHPLSLPSRLLPSPSRLFPPLAPPPSSSSLLSPPTSLPPSLPSRAPPLSSPSLLPPLPPLWFPPSLPFLSHPLSTPSSSSSSFHPSPRPTPILGVLAQRLFPTLAWSLEKQRRKRRFSLPFSLLMIHLVPLGPQSLLHLRLWDHLCWLLVL